MNDWIHHCMLWLLKDLDNSQKLFKEKSYYNALKRLLEIFNDLSELVEKYQPDCASVENLFFFKNQKTVIPVAEARGVILTVLEKYNIPTYNYTPMEVKQVLTGYGRAEKKEVQQMVGIALQTDKLPKLDDTVDAIAIAICHSRSII